MHSLPSVLHGTYTAYNNCAVHIQVASRKADFDVLLTSYDFLMGKHDRPRLSKLRWEYIIVDEGHRLKNAGCKLNAEIKIYNTKNRLLLTGSYIG